MRIGGFECEKNARLVDRAFLLAFLLRVKAYFLRRENMPVKKEPIPKSPSKGSGDAVCGSLPLLLPAAAFWSAAELVPAALWSLAAEDGVELAAL